MRSPLRSLRLLGLALCASAAVGCEGRIDALGGDAGPLDGRDARVATDFDASLDAAAVPDARAPTDSGSSDASSSDASSPDASSPDAGSPDAGSSDAGSSDAGGAAPGITIEFDYRFDTSGWFADPVRRRALEAAAAIWSARIVDDFENIPVGTTVRVQDPEDPDATGMNFAIDREIDDVLVFVACASLPGTHNAITRSSAAIGSVSDPALSARLSDRWYGSDYEPWVSAITFECSGSWYFDPTPDTASDIPSASRDFITVAAHELGHVLGFGNSDAYRALVSGGTFVGATAVRVYGGPVPLASSEAHFLSGLSFGGLEPLLDPEKGPGLRVEPTNLDLAVLADIGYALRSPL